MSITTATNLNSYTLLQLIAIAYLNVACFPRNVSTLDHTRSIFIVEAIFWNTFINMIRKATQPFSMVTQISIRTKQTTSGIDINRFQSKMMPWPTWSPEPGCDLPNSPDPSCLHLEYFHWWLMRSEKSSLLCLERDEHLFTDTTQLLNHHSPVCTWCIWSSLKFLWGEN